MVYTLTTNPSLDYEMHTQSLITGSVNRSTKESLRAGGKGINVALVLKNLGVDATALGFTAGFTGEQIETELRNLGVNADFIRLKKGISRINVKIESSEETEINSAGPEITQDAVDSLMKKMESLSDGDTLVLAGSIPPSLPKDFYRNILKKTNGKKIMTVVDASKNLLLDSLAEHPFLIKPNDAELGEIFSVEISSEESAIQHTKKLQEMGARNVLVSLGSKGAVLVCENGQVFSCPAPKGKVISTVGSGDSMVAGFIAGFQKSGSFKEALILGISAGSASAFSEGLASAESIEIIRQKVKDSFANS
jgi:1-phosphofructokinase